MPELPDIELFRQLVERHCRGRIIAKATVLDPGILRDTSPSALQHSLVGSRLMACRRHGKILFIEVNGSAVLAMHFGTNGSLRYVVPNQSEPPYTRLRLDFTDGDHLAYINPRRIGRVVLARSVEAIIDRDGLGPDALDPSLDAEALAGLLGKRAQSVKAVLMDQTLIAGIGNIFADEILFQAKVHPNLRASSLNAATIRCLFQTMRSVLRTAIERGVGAEVSTTQTPKGFLLPERHSRGRCPRCRTPIQADKRGGRTTYYCPACQPKND